MTQCEIKEFQILIGDKSYLTKKLISIEEIGEMDLEGLNI